jgi:hypothetical protein
MCHWKCYSDMSLKRLPQHVTKKATPIRLLKGYGDKWTVTEKATLTCHWKSTLLCPWKGYGDEWQVTEKSTVMSDRSLKSLRWWVIGHWKVYTDMSLKRLLWHITEKAPSTYFYWIMDQITTQYYSL